MKKFGIIALVLVLLLVTALVAGALWYTTAHVFIGDKVYPKDVQVLDYRQEIITAEYYDHLRDSFPEAEILWNVPFQGNLIPQDSPVLTVQSLTQEDLAQLSYFEDLEVVDATGCTDYGLLESLRALRPDLEIRYTVPLGGKDWQWDVDTVVVEQLTQEDCNRLGHLPNLRNLDARGCREYDLLEKLRRDWPNLWVQYTVLVAGKEYPTDTAQLYLTGASVAELSRSLCWLPQLQKVGLQDPVTEEMTISALQKQYPQIEFTWETAIQGISLTSTQREVDLSGVENPDLEILEKTLAQYPLLEQVFLGQCGGDNEALAAYRERVRGDYKVVWTVQIGQMAVRTDETTFMPTKYGYDLTEAEAYNLRYCEDMICVDVGHKDITTCQWAAFMPHLKYLIVADTQVGDLSPLTGLQELVYLEAFVTPVYDYTPLLSCPALEDLNISYTYGNYQIIYQMTGLKRLWWAGTYLSPILAQEKLPDTELMFHRISSTGDGWREGQHYYDMRELLEMEIMYG